MADTIKQENTITLDYPFEFEGGQITEIKLRRVKFRDIEAMADLSSEIEKTKLLICNLAEVSPELVGEIDAVDLETINIKLADIMAK